MSILKIFDDLNADLAREFAHWHFYQNAATSVKGLHRLEISEFFAEQAASEQKHVQEFQRVLHGLKTRRAELKDKTISSTACTLDYLVGASDPTVLLNYAVKMEDLVVKNYTLRIADCEDFEAKADSIDDRIDAKYISLFLEDQLLDSRADADNMLEMLTDFGS